MTYQNNSHKNNTWRKLSTTESRKINVSTIWEKSMGQHQKPEIHAFGRQQIAKKQHISMRVGGWGKGVLQRLHCEICVFYRKTAETEISGGGINVTYIKYNQPRFQSCCNYSFSNKLITGC